MSELIEPPLSIIDFIYGDSWFGDGDNKEVLVRYYSFPVHTGGEINFLPVPGTDIKFLDQPFRVIICDISDQEYASFHYSWVSSPKGPGLIAEKIQRILPPSTYVIVSVPLRGGGNESGLENSVSLMDQFIGLIRAVTGNGFLREIVREEIVTIPSGQMKAPSDLLGLPHPAEGPFLRPNNWSDIEEMVRSIPLLPSDKSNRLKLACQLFEKAARTEVPSKFFLYWVAMEVLCDTHKAANFVMKLQLSYNASKEYIQDNLGFKKLVRLRQDLFHEGKHHDIPQDVERYIQVVFLDLIRASLQLPCKKHIESFVRDGFDVRRLDRDVGRRIVQDFHY